MRMTRVLVLGALTGMTVSGCSRNQPGAGLAPEDTAAIRVENENIADMRISIFRAPSGAAYRLGIARGLQTTTLRVPRSIVTGVNEVTFEITPLSGGYTRFTRTITISPGDEIVVRIPAVI
jgi:hypothetical protein